MKKIKIILFTGGGSGGHVMPLIAIVRELKKISQSSDFLLHYAGPKEDCLLIQNERLETHPLIIGKIRRYFSFTNFIDFLFFIPLSFIQSFFLVMFLRPSLVFSKGGSGSLPITYAAKIFKIPVFIHESDSVTGKSNKITAKWAKKVFISFENTIFFNKPKTVLTGNPIRKDLINGNKEEAKAALGITSQKPVILIWGGSQGAQAINSFLMVVLSNLLQNYEVIHVSGKKNYKAVSLESRAFLADKSQEESYHLHDFLDQNQVKNAYSACDIIISRAGSASIFEIAALGKPSILIPLPTSAHNHQTKNAYEYAKNGACIVIEQDDLSPGFFLGEIYNILSQSDKMKKSALEFSKPAATENIAKEIMQFLKNETI